MKVNKFSVEHHFTSIFSIEELAKQETGMKQATNETTL
jgi:hypothetical protein